MCKNHEKGNVTESVSSTRRLVHADTSSTFNNSSSYIKIASQVGKFKDYQKKNSSQWDMVTLDYRLTCFTVDADLPNHYYYLLEKYQKTFEIIVKNSFTHGNFLESIIKISYHWLDYLFI